MFLTFGCDMAYMKAGYNYAVMDVTINEWQKMYPEIEIFYSTPEKYVRALKESKVEWPVRRDDSLPYSQT